MRFPDSYRAFLQAYGGGMVGGYPVFGLRKAEPMGKSSWSDVDVTKRYRAQGWPGVADWIVVSADHSGNPIGLDRNGSLMLADHDGGEIVCVARDFDEFLASYCLHMWWPGF
ncbi:MAG: SMI1/KNR4 family protein [Deltaproteobacteria bacterium]|nr:SMI1/KNR4 family protein [Deltaproteobacteria bacterium]